ncbi:MAG: DUF86 domain-containing protein [Planctomycetes bacterium]|nr:DUF86 domain-containing protein [Planctomycetota bacterium]
MRRDDAWLLDILLACRDVTEFVQGVSREQFMKDKMLQGALCHKLVVIGEAARAVSDEFKAAHALVPWRDLVGLRNRIAHEYFRLDLDIIWEISRKDVPSLITVIAPLVPPGQEC